MTEWLIPANLNKYNVIEAFNEFKRIEWKQSANIEIGDIIYIYVSFPLQAIKFKCKVNKNNISTRTIDDSKYYINEDFSATSDRFLEIELINSYSSELFAIEYLEKHDFIIPQGPYRISVELKKYLSLVNSLINSEELDPNSHDGSYLLLQETINSYKNMQDISLCDYRDLNLIYHMVIGTWKQGISKKTISIQKSNLPDPEKARLENILKSIWENALNQKYSNQENNVATIGMFGTGFYSFEKNTDKNSVIDFIKMCINIIDIQNDNDIYTICEKTLKNEIKGMKVASASVILHCLKPLSFPILNNNQGAKNIYEYLSIPITNLGELNTYINNCKIIKEFRDKNFTVKNYRIFDLKARDIINQFTEIDYIAILDYLEKYNGSDYANPAKEELSNELKDKYKKIKKEAKRIVNELKKIVTFCKDYFDLSNFGQISWLDGSNTKVRNYLWVQLKDNKYQNNPISISIVVEISEITNKPRFSFSLEIKNQKATQQQLKSFHTHLDIPIKLDSKLKYISSNNENGSKNIVEEPVDIIKNKIESGIYKKIQISRIVEQEDNLSNIDYEKLMIESIKELIPYYEHVIGEDEMLNNDNIIYKKEDIKLKTQFDKNLIFYGPPGTGKTYHTAIYAVAICDGKKIEELTDYDYVKKRYHELEKEGRINFTTFHQSFSYEDFIEGIKPIVNEETKEISYEIKDGLFKDFCNEAKSFEIESENSLIKEDAVLWKITINNGDLNDIKKECFLEDNIRIGFSYDSKNAKSFVEDINIGDVILSLKTRKIIDGIGVVTSEAFELNNKDRYKTARKIKWLAKEVNENILEINKGKQLARAAVAHVPNMLLPDLIDLIERINPEIKHTQIKKKTDPYVFIIDEINRGNISKIFGELITLIEDKKREGMKEELQATLPYSKDYFSVPQNVYIIGTMNTADRSIALLDTALRRRFKFKEMLPNLEVLKGYKVEDLEIYNMIYKINERISFLYDREHTIGHSYFMDLKDENATIEKLQIIFEKSIIPLLQEYFYEDYEKIQLVLGDNNKSEDTFKFILDKKVNSRDIFKGNVDEIIDLPEKTYQINKEAFLHIESYKEI